jgi:hypothetical protein
MICKEIKYYLRDYADGFLINEMRKEIATHLEDCIDCKNHYLDLLFIIKEAVSLPKRITSYQDLGRLINEKSKSNKNKKTSLKVLSISPLDNYLNTGKKSSFMLKKQYKKSGWFFAGAVVIAIVLGIALGILYYSQYSL